MYVSPCISSRSSSGCNIDASSELLRNWWGEVEAKFTQQLWQSQELQLNDNYDLKENMDITMIGRYKLKVISLPIHAYAQF